MVFISPPIMTDSAVLAAFLDGLGGVGFARTVVCLGCFGHAALYRPRAVTET
jgi:hypothetical protein